MKYASISQNKVNIKGKIGYHRFRENLHYSLISKYTFRSDHKTKQITQIQREKIITTYKLKRPGRFLYTF